MCCQFGQQIFRQLQLRTPGLTILTLLTVWLSAMAHGEEPPSIVFSEHLIADNYAYAYGIAAADFDNDGDLDLSSADYTPHNKLYLFENDGAGNFRKHLIQENEPTRIERHLVGDIDGDGDLDVVIVKNLNGHVLWFENSGSPTDGKLWKRHVVTTNLPGAYDVALADFNGDGRLDVAGSSWILGNQFAWFENNGPSDSEEWTKHMVEENVRETRTMRAADFDGDGDPDLLGTIRGIDEIVWYENDQPANGPWKKHLVKGSFDDAFEATGADLDGDGDIDIVATTWRNPGRVAWFENTGDPRGEWIHHPLKENWTGANQVIVADMNGDGKPDIVACSEKTSLELRWWKNEGLPTTAK